MKSLFLLLLALTVQAQEKTILLLEVSRHGAREPLQLFNLTKNPNANFNGSGNLTPLGKKEHFELGAFIRQKYSSQAGFIPAEYNLEDIFVESSDTNRTYLSSMY